jgi:hypothetical protein
LRQRFRGEIAGVGSTSGTRVVVGNWYDTPLGSFADAMVETAAGHRVLIASRQEVADFIRSTYAFDEVRIEPIEVVDRTFSWEVRSDSLELFFDIGDVTPTGRLLRTVPRSLAERPAWSTLVDPVARVVMPGVRTRGTAGNDRREWYGATDNRRITRIDAGSFDGVPLGDLANLDPPCRFGFSSTPKRPSVTTVVTTVSDSSAG